MKPFLSNLFLNLLVGFWQILSTASVIAQTAPVTNDRKALIAEIERMVKTPEQEIDNFKIQYATSANIDALYRDPKVSELPKIVRENGLIFAGHGNTLRFEKPSDILQKISQWFPQELAEARQSRNGRFFSHIDLFGPYWRWGDDASAFIALWKCAPETVWLHPNDSPFLSRPHKGVSFTGSNFGANTGNNFKACLLNFSIFDRAADQNTNYVLRARIVDKLKEKFAHFIASDSCTKTGPDDCVLIFWMWSNIAPEDARLAQALQKLAPVVYEPSLNPPERQSEAYLIQEFRKANFLRSQINSYFADRELWPQDALTHMLERLIKMTEDNATARNLYNDHYAFSGENGNLLPTVLLGEPYISESVTKVAFNQLLTSSTVDLSCSPIFEQVSASVRRNYVLARAEKNLATQCLDLDTGMREGNPQVSKMDADQLLPFIADTSNGRLREAILSQLPCKDVEALKKTKGLLGLCQTSISEPQQVEKKLHFTGLHLSARNKYKETWIENFDPNKEAQDDWLHRVLTSLGATNQESQNRIIDSLDKNRISLDTPQLWANKLNGDKLLIFSPPYGDRQTQWPFSNSRFFIAIHDQVATLVGVPGRFNYQYDEGSILAITDLDKDGRIEVWFTGEFGECDGDGLVAGVDCAISFLHMGEIHGDALSFFRDDRPTKKQGRSMSDQILNAADALDRRLNAQCKAKSIAYRKDYWARGYRNFDIEFIDMKTVSMGRKIGQCYQKMKKIVFVKRPRKPYEELRLDGVFQNMKPMSGEAAFLQFYVDGTVLIDTGNDDRHTASFLNALSKEAFEKDAAAKGKYEFKDSELAFSASGYSVGVVKFVGRLIKKNGKYLLQTRSASEDNDKVIQAVFEFVPQLRASVSSSDK